MISGRGVYKLILCSTNFSGPVDSWCSLVLDQCTFEKKISPWGRCTILFLNLDPLLVDIRHVFSAERDIP
jgi:hypothetical protein